MTKEIKKEIIVEQIVFTEKENYRKELGAAFYMHLASEVADEKEMSAKLKVKADQMEMELETNRKHIVFLNKKLAELEVD
jgi:hypothetical protein